MGFPDAWGHEPEHLYFCGLRDGDIPSRPDMDFFLPERLRAELGLRTMKRHLLLEEFNFRRIAGSARNVHLSYPEMEADKVFLPSVFISEGRRVKDPVYGIFSLEEKLVRGGRALYTDSISQIRVRRVFRKGRRFRVTEIDGFRTCPRKFFIEGVAGLRPLEPKRYELDPKTTGTIMHAVMEKLVPFAGLEYPAFRLVARETVEKALRKERVEPYWRDLLGESFLGVLPDIYEIEQDFRKQGFNPAKAEFDIRGDLKGVPLKGKIDRIDARDGAHQIIDYKSGNIDLNPKDILNRGASLQLFLYAALAKQQGFNPDRVGIYSLKETKVRFVPGKDGAKEGRTLGDYVTAALGFLEHTHASLLEGDFRAEPIGDQTCRRCHERPYCPFIHGEAGERG
jgi:RecB family exonuclease